MRGSRVIFFYVLAGEQDDVIDKKDWIFLVNTNH